MVFSSRDLCDTKSADFEIIGCTSTRILGSRAKNFKILEKSSYNMQHKQPHCTLCRRQRLLTMGNFCKVLMLTDLFDQVWYPHPQRKKSFCGKTFFLVVI